MPLHLPELDVKADEPVLCGLYAISLEGPRKQNKVYKLGMAAGSKGLRSRINSYHVCPNSSEIGLFIYALLIVKECEYNERLRRVRLLEAELFALIKKTNPSYYREDYRKATGAREFFSIPNAELKQFFRTIASQHPEWVAQVIVEFPPIKEPGGVKRAGGITRRIEPADWELEEDEKELTPEEIAAAVEKAPPAQTHSARGRVLKQTAKGNLHQLEQAQTRAERAARRDRRQKVLEKKSAPPAPVVVDELPPSAGPPKKK